jgi:hypothetical protein
MRPNPKTNNSVPPKPPAVVPVIDIRKSVSTVSQPRREH